MATATTTWTTLAIVGYQCSVSRDENRSAHGGICLLQIRRGKNGLLGRRVNSNGRHREIGEAFDLDADTLAHWESIAKSRS